MPGFRLNIVDGPGRTSRPGQRATSCWRCRCRPGTLTTLWGNDERYISSYLQAFEGYYATGDSGYRDEDGYVFVMGRTDDIINVAGHRLSTGAMEQVIGQHPAVAECAVIGLADPLKGQRPSGYVVLKSGVDVPEEILVKDLIALVRRDIGAVADFKHVTVVEALPKTRSGQDPAQDHAPDCRRRGVRGAVDDRGRRRDRPAHRNPPPCRECTLRRGTALLSGRSSGIRSPACPARRSAAVRVTVPASARYSR